MEVNQSTKQGEIKMTTKEAKDLLGEPTEVTDPKEIEGITGNPLEDDATSIMLFDCGLHCSKLNDGKFSVTIERSAYVEDSIDGLLVFIAEFGLDEGFLSDHCCDDNCRQNGCNV